MTRGRAEAVVIGASAGALEALSIVLSALPADFRLPIMVVVHLPPDRESLFAELLDQRCRLAVTEAADKEMPRPGVIYLAPRDYHLLIEPDRRLSLSNEEPVLYSRPSIDVLFETAAEVYGSALVGVVLTGANNDGANGLRAVSKAGGRAIVQDPLSAYASAMPEAARAACPESEVLGLEAVAARLVELGVRERSEL